MRLYESWKKQKKIEFKKITFELKEGIISLFAMLNKWGEGTLFFCIRKDEDQPYIWCRWCEGTLFFCIRKDGEVIG